METQEELKERKERNLLLMIQKESLQQGLKREYEDGGFLGKMGMFWKEFVKE